MMIDRSLVLLARLRFGAWLRRMRRALSTRRGVVFCIIGCLVFSMWLIPGIIGLATNSQPHSTPATVRQYMPLVLLALTLIMALLSRGKIISFSAAEIDFLFPGPFSRHQLVLYKIAVTGFATLWVALVFSIWQARHASLWLAAFVGIWLAWMFAQSLAMLLILARQAITAGRSSPLVRLGMALLLVIIAAGVVEIARPLFHGEWDGKALLAHARDSIAGRVVLAPFDVLTATFTAERLWPDLVQWTALSAVMIAALIALVLLFDAYFIETALVASERLQTRVKRMRRGGNPFTTSKPIARLRVSMLPRLGGAGPLAWRQLTAALRGARGLLLLVALLVLGIGPMIWGMSRTTVAHPAAMFGPLLIIGGTWLIVMLPSMLRFDFRGDLPHMDTLKLLPLPPSVVAVGQMLAPLALITLLTWAVIAVVGIVLPGAALGAMIAAAFAPVLLTLVLGIENAVFLMFPTAQTMTTPGDMSMLGRTMVVFFVKMLGLLTALGVVAGMGTAAYMLTKSWPVTLIVGWITLACAAAGTVPIIARLFVRFDPSVDRPPE